MEFYLLASGSKGNCFVLKTVATQIVIDCGTTKTYLTRSFHMIGVDYLNTEALLVTHGHRDHTSQLKMFSGVEAYAAFGLENRADQHWIKPYTPFQVGDLRVRRCRCPTMLKIPSASSWKRRRKSWFTLPIPDMSREECVPLIAGCGLLCVESNHDVGMLMQTRRPYPIKMRILSDSGHLCNEDCAHLLTRLVTPRTRSIFLAHLSEEANQPQLACRSAPTP